MSAVLDAIKKSQKTRAKQTVPTLTTPDSVKSKPSKPWFKIILILALLAGAIFAMFWFKPYKSLPLPLKASNDINAANELSIASNDLHDESEEVKQAGNGGGTGLQINAVSYSLEKEKRLVMISGKVYREGDLVNGDYQIILIKRSSVSLRAIEDSADVVVLSL